MKTIQGYLTALLSIPIKDDIRNDILRNSDDTSVVTDEIGEKLRKQFGDVVFTLYSYQRYKPDHKELNKFFMDSKDQLKIASMALLINKLCVDKVAQLIHKLDDGKNAKEKHFDGFAESLTLTTAELFDSIGIHSKITEVAMDLISRIANAKDEEEADKLMRFFIGKDKLSNLSIDDVIDSIST